MDYKIELVAQALHRAEHNGRWDNEPIVCQERFREYARNAIRLLGDDIGVLLLSLEQCRSEPRAEPPRSMALRKGLRSPRSA
ncbi:hypothetical protein KBI52_01455 [Microvirga sp. HBU67558]|nr:hypothetical protein [Microvirga sp. HBU67558]